MWTAAGWEGGGVGAAPGIRGGSSLCVAQAGLSEVGPLLLLLLLLHLVVEQVVVERAPRAAGARAMP